MVAVAFVLPSYMLKLSNDGDDDDNNKNNDDDNNNNDDDDDNDEFTVYEFTFFEKTVYRIYR